MRKSRGNHYRTLTASAMAAVLAWGCQNTHKEVSFRGEPDADHYRTHATAIEYPDVVTETPEAVRDSLPPRTLDTQERCEIRDIQLADVVQYGLAHSEIVKSGGQFLSAGNGILNSPDRTLSSYDSAIQESGVLFGGRGVEAALADFDAQLESSATWGRNDTENNRLDDPLDPADDDFARTRNTGDFASSLSKTFANGGRAEIAHQLQYLRSDQFGQKYPTSYTGNLSFDYQHPLLAGSGTEFTRIAGPIARSFGGITGVSQGVVIARINNDLVLCDYENGLRNMVRDIEDAYWNLYLAYRNFDTSTWVYESSLATWRKAKTEVDNGLLAAGQAAQARDALFTARASMETTRSNIYTRETELRRLIGLPVNDGTVLRPSEEPTTAQLAPDWNECLTDALTHRVELRKQKWQIRSLDLQLIAARSLTRPRLDAVAGYQVNSLGDNFASYGDGNSYLQGITANRTDGWNAGVVMTMPVGLRSAHAQVQNYELRLVKARKALEVAEEEVSHEMAVAFQEITRAYTVARTNLNRYMAADENAAYFKVRVREGAETLDEELRALARRGESEQAYYQSLVDYNKAITNLFYRKGTILTYNNIQLMEGGWHPDAYTDAHRRHGQRAYGRAIDATTEPAAFSAPGPVDGVELSSQPTARGLIGQSAVENTTPPVLTAPPVAPAP